MRRDVLNVVDLFAGCGALSAGFASADAVDYRIVCAIELDTTAAESFSTNHPGTTVIARDIRDVGVHEINKVANLSKGDIDVVIGGPPCQGFSTAGRRLDADPRNDLFVEFARLVREIRPRVAVMENVPQWLTNANGERWKLFQDSMHKAGYYSESAMLVASDYGVPQARHRAFCISVENTWLEDTITFPIPTHQQIRDMAMLQRGDLKGLTPADPRLKRFVSVREAIGDLPHLGPDKTVCNRYLPGNPTNYQRNRRKGQTILTEHEYRNHSKELLSYTENILEGSRMIDTYDTSDWKGSGFRQAYARLHRNGIGNTVTASFHNPGSGRFIHYRDNRAISIREAARLQSFDDDYAFIGAKTQKQTQIGNAVPPLLARSVAEHIYKTIFQKQAIPVAPPIVTP